jgi:hypothetical protein
MQQQQRHPPPLFGVRRTSSFCSNSSGVLSAPSKPPEVRADRFVAVVDTAPRLVPRHGLKGSVAYAPQRRRKGWWWLVCHVRHADSKQRLTASELRARFPCELMQLKDSTTDARSVRTFRRNLKRAKGYVCVAASAI